MPATRGGEARGSFGKSGPLPVTVPMEPEHRPWKRSTVMPGRDGRDEGERRGVWAHNGVVIECLRVVASLKHAHASNVAVNSHVGVVVFRGGVVAAVERVLALPRCMIFDAACEQVTHKEWREA